MRQYPYHPLPRGIDAYWTRPIELYEYLLRTPSERERIRREICQLVPNEPFIARIYHPCLRGMLTYSTVDNDDAFIRRIMACREYETHPENVLFRQPGTEALDDSSAL